MYDVWAVSPNLAWAVGSTVHDGFVLRWDGSSWTVADGPRRGSLQTIWAGSDTAATRHLDRPTAQTEYRPPAPSPTRRPEPRPPRNRRPAGFP